MAGLSVFMKRRIQQLVDEYNDPQMVLEQIQNASEDLSEEEEEEIVEYLYDICPQVDYDESPFTENPIEFIRQFIDPKGNLNLPNIESGLVENILDMTDTHICKYEESAFSKIDTLSQKSRDKIRKSVINLSPFKNTIASLSIMKDIQNLVGRMREKNIILTLNKDDSPNLASIKKVHLLISDSPYVDSAPPKSRKDNLYLTLLPDLMRNADLLTKVKKTLIVSSRGKKFVSSDVDELTDIYRRIVTYLLIDDSKISDSNPLKRFLTEYRDFCFFSAMLSIGEEWRDFEIGAVPLLAEANSDIASSMGASCFSNVLFHRHLNDYMINMGDFLEKMGLLEIRLSEGNNREIRLTSMGKYIMEKLFSFYPLPCKILAEMLISQNLSNYLHMLMNSNDIDSDKLYKSKEYKELENAMMESASFYFDFISIVAGNKASKQDMEELESRANKISKKIKEGIDSLLSLL